MARSIHWSSEVPALRRPVLIVSLDGFIDAGSAGETAAMFLRHRWTAESVATFDHDEFIDYRARRPTTVIDAGVLRRIEVDPISLLVATVEGSDHDAVFLLGPEPDMRWEAFCEAVVAVARSLGVERVIALGAYPAAAPHTRPTNVTLARNTAAVDVDWPGLPTAHDVPSYTGPIGAQIMLLHRMGDAGMPAVGIWAEVPHYIAANNHPSSALALVGVVADTFGVEVDTTELQAAAAAHTEQVDEAVADHPEAAIMISRLEEHLDDGGEVMQVPSGDDLAAEIERFLSDRGE